MTDWRKNVSVFMDDDSCDMYVGASIVFDNCDGSIRVEENGETIAHYDSDDFSLAVYSVSPSGPIAEYSSQPVTTSKIRLTDLQLEKVTRIPLREVFKSKFTELGKALGV